MSEKKIQCQNQKCDIPEEVTLSDEEVEKIRLQLHEEAKEAIGGTPVYPGSNDGVLFSGAEYEEKSN